MVAMLVLYKLWSTGCDKQLIHNTIHHCMLPLGHQIPMPLQFNAVSVTLNGEDTFLNVPTRYGKSLVFMIYHCVPSLFWRLWAPV